MFVQLAFKYRQNNTHYRPLFSHSAKHQQRARIIAGLSPIAGKVHLYRADELLHSVLPSVCSVPTIYSKTSNLLDT